MYIAEQQVITLWLKRGHTSISCTQLSLIELMILQSLHGATETILKLPPEDQTDMGLGAQCKLRQCNLPACSCEPSESEAEFISVFTVFTV